MELKRTNWTENDIEEFHKYLKSFSKGEKSALFEKKICCTRLNCIAVPSQKVKEIVREIKKGNFESFLRLFPWENLTEVFVVAGLIPKIKSFEKQKPFIDKYVERADCWAMTDSLKLEVKKEKEKYFCLAENFVKDKRTFVRRMGIILLFKFLDDERYIEKIFELANGLYDEKEYYVNMAVAWLLAECFVKQREKTLKFLENHNLNKFVINKTVSKCRDSLRVSEEDKEYLLKFRQK